MIAEFSAALGGIKAAADIAGGIRAQMTEVALNGVKVELLSRLIDVQQTMLTAHDAHAAALKTIHQLEQQIVSMENWEGEAARYVLTDAGQGTLCYRVKPEMQGMEPAHWLCPTCYQGAKKSILQPETITPGRGDALVCNTCGADHIIRGHRDPGIRPRVIAGKRR